MGSIPGWGTSSGGGKWQPTPVFLFGKFHGRGSWRATAEGCKESDTTEHIHTDDQRERENKYPNILKQYIYIYKTHYLNKNVS